jgi:hypothetical protein
MADDDRPPLDSFVVKPKRPPLSQFTAGKIPSQDPMGVGERLVTGMQDPLVGSKQLLTHVTGTPQEQEQVDKQVREREAGVQAREGGGFVRGLGSAIPAAPLIAAGPIGGALGAAAAGALSGAVQPVTGNDYWTQKTQDALFNAAFGLGGGMLGGTLTPMLRPEAKALVDQGVKLTPGQMAGGIPRRAEEAFKSLPILGNFIRGAEKRGIEGFNKAVLNQSLEPIGQKLSPTTEAGHDAILEARNKFSAAYDALLPNLKLNLDQDLVNDVANVKFLATELPESYQKQFDSILRNRLAAFFVRSPVVGRQGPTLKETESALRNIADNYRGSQDPGARNMAMRIDDIRGALRDALMRQNPQSADLLSKIDKGYAMFIRAQGAAARRATSEGVFTPNDLLQTIKSQDKTVRKGAFAQGDALLQEFAEYGQKVLPGKMPDSGTPERGLWTAATLGGAYEAPQTALGAAAGLGLASLPYTRPGIGALNALAGSPGPVRQGIGLAVRRVAPYAAIASEPSAREYAGPQQ